MPVRPRLVATVALALAAAAAVVGVSPAPSAAGIPRATVTHDCVSSVPGPNSTSPVAICYSLFKPATASSSRRVPLLFHSHGWGGSRAKDLAAVKEFTDAGYGVLSFDQRGFGESGGKAQVMNPAYEGHDVRRLVSLVAALPWVAKDGPGDPRLGAVGGSYGGGYQFVGAFESLRIKGKPVFDALAPEITWYDLSESLAPEGVVRTAWALALSAGAVPSDALPASIYKALVEGAATGTWPDGSVPGTENLEEFFAKNGPKHHVRSGRRLDIPVLLGQGATDSLFNLQQGLANWQHALTPRARQRSIFVAYNGGHVLPSALPRGIAVTSDPCSKKLAGGNFRALSVRFFDTVLKDRRTGLTGWGKYHLATPTSTCTTVSSVAPDRAVEVGTVATTETAGAPLAFEVARGPLRIAGTPHLSGTVTALGVNNRAFYGLAIGTNPLDAQLIQDNVLPFHSTLPVQGEQRRIALPSVAVDVPAGQSLFLVASPVSDTFVGMGSRTPGAVVVQDARVHLPVV